MQQQTTVEPIRMARILATALAMGVLGFYLVAWFVTAGGTRPMAPDMLGGNHDLALWIWAAIALGGFAGALMFRGRALAPTERHGALGATQAVTPAGLVQTNLLVAWAMLEGPALFAGVIFLMLGSVRILWLAAIVYFIGFAITFPRAEWFGIDARP